MLQSFGAEESGLDQLARVGLPHARAADLPHGRARRSRAPGRSTRAGRPRRPRASSTPTSSAASSRPRSCRSRDLDCGGLDGRGPGRRAGCAWRARSTSCRTATSWSSASTCKRRRSQAQSPPPARRLLASAPRTSATGAVAAPRVRSSAEGHSPACQVNAGSESALWFVVLTWVLRPAAWGFVALFVAGFTSAIRKPWLRSVARALAFVCERVAEPHSRPRPRYGRGRGGVGAQTRRSGLADVGCRFGAWIDLDGRRLRRWSLHREVTST